MNFRPRPVFSNIFRGAAIAVLAATAFVAAAGESWLQLDKSETGFLFRGIGEEAGYSFDVPGAAIRTAREGDRAFAEIDGVVLQVFKTARGKGDDAAALAAYRDSETAYLAGQGMKIADSDVCAAMTHPHREWRGTAPSGAVSWFLVLPLRRSLLVVAAAADPGQDAAGRSKLAAACATFKPA